MNIDLVQFFFIKVSIIRWISLETHGFMLKINNFGVLLDPYICETGNLPHNTTYPIEPMHITNAKNTITLDQTLAELKEYWQRTRKF